MNKTEKIIFFIALTLILVGLALCVVFPGEPLFIPVGIGCLLLQVLRTTITHRAEQARVRVKAKVKAKARRFKSNVKALAADIANDHKHLSSGK